MSTAYVFPGQGAQAPGMAAELHAKSELARSRFAEAADILGFDIGKLMFEGTPEDLQRTSVTQPAVFLHAVILYEALAPSDAAMMAGHSLGEFSALVASGCLGFADGLKLVAQRAQAMQAACDAQPSTMAAILGMEDMEVAALCAEVTDTVVVPANYNSPGQIVISGTVAGVEKAVALAKEKGVRLAKVLAVDGAFHSPLMEPARKQLAAAIEATSFSKPICPIYQNATAQPATDPSAIQKNLIDQLTAPVLWTQTVHNMKQDGATHFVELGPGKVLRGLIQRILPEGAEAESRSSLPE